MIKKGIDELKENAVKLIFKNSNNTIHTYSKTCSGASQFFTKNLILQLKENLPKDNYYKDNGSLKRDLSIETDYCILRTYIKKKRNTKRETTSQKSKYSVNRTEIDSIDKCSNDMSACGDSENNIPGNTNININLTSLVVNNFKNLLNDWFRTYVLENSETKAKIETVLDSILHQFDLQRNNTPSSHTYILNIEVDQNLQEAESKSLKLQDVVKTPSNNILKVENRKSTLTIPLSGKHLKVISTLSLPRNIHKIRKAKSVKNFRFRHKRNLLSTKNSSLYDFKSSNLDFLKLSTKSLIKYCATHEENKCNNMNSKVSIYKINKEIVSSIYKHIAGINNLSDCKSKLLNEKESLCVSEKYNNDHLESVHLVKDKAERTGKETRISQNTSSMIAKVMPRKDRKKSNVCKKLISKYRSYKNKKCRKYTYLFKKSNNYIQQEKELLQHFRSIFRYFSNYNGNNDLKLDIKVNISTTQENKLYNSVLNINNEKPNNKAVEHTVLVTNCNNSKLTPNETKKTASNIKQNIISLFDGAASQTNIIKSRGASIIVEKEEIEPFKCKLKSSKLAREISELKIIVQSLATITEKLVNEHMDKKMKFEASNLTNEKISKSIQFSNNIPKSQIISGLKLKKEPKKKITGEYNPPSYNIIDSESVLKVTDMTSAAQVTTMTAMDKGLTCSLPKSKSLFEVSVGSEKKLLAFHCNDSIKPYPYNVRHNIPSNMSIPVRNTFHPIHPSQEFLKYNQINCCDLNCGSGHLQPKNNEHQLYGNDNCTSSCCIDIDKSCDDKIKMRNRNRLYFWKGLMYCILLWIPVLIVLWLFYVYAVDEMMKSSQQERHLQKIYSSASDSSESQTTFNLKDLGF